MAITTLPSRKLNHDVNRAKNAPIKGPVFIIDRGKPAQVLLSIEEYQRLTKQQCRNIANALAIPGIADIEFESPRASVAAKSVDFLWPSQTSRTTPGPI